MDELLTIVCTTTLVFVVQQFLSWTLSKLKSNRRKKRKEQNRVVLRKEN